jgi:Protein of unknown function (DUF2783)
MKPSTANLQPNWTDADGFYERLLDAHQGLNLEQSAALNAKLLLVLANQIGDAQVLAQCIDAVAKPSARFSQAF